ncbi:MAG: transglycosylase, partial [Nitrosospira sp.]|nr:transglycosylase [Nitrosospira sp.]
MKNQLSFLAVASLLLLNACTMAPTRAPVVDEKPVASTVAPAASAPAAVLKPTDWNALTGWTDDDILPAWDAFLRSCAVLRNQPLWQDTCVQADTMRGQDSVTLRQFF